jgi:glycosyltransferase involved in cell wall biosynthesis
LVNQFQLLAMLKNNLATVQHCDMPFIMSHWGSGQNSAGFNSEDQSMMSDLNHSLQANGVYRIFAPLELVADTKLPTLTFAVTEFGLDNEKYPMGFANEYVSMGGKIHTPSQWSKYRLLANSIPAESIHVIPHAADPDYFFKLNAEDIEINRTNLGYEESDILILNVGTHHWNKGLDVLIKAYATARQTNNRLKLVLKDQRSTYLMNSESYVHQVLKENNFDNEELLSSIKLISGHLNLLQLNNLYNMADAYVTPYRAEGFNLPALEAQTCGTPVIATKGGATDDFLSNHDNFFIPGKLHENANLKNDLTINAYIEPDLSFLVMTLENLKHKKTITPSEKRNTWDNACKKIASLLTSF